LKALPSTFSEAIVWAMTTDTLTTLLDERADLAGGFSKRVLRVFKTQVEDWQDVCCRVSEWENRHLLDAPTPQKLSEHSDILDELERWGRWFSLATQGRDFPDRPTAELVVMTLQDLKDRRALWHGKLKPKQREEILHAVFNES
jgi:hypothetical protein